MPSVTSLPQSPKDEQRGRVRRYLVTMAVRTVCFVLASWTAAMGSPWWVWGTLAVLAVVLPYVAVVAVNAVRPRAAGSASSPTPVDRTPRIDR